MIRAELSRPGGLGPALACGCGEAPVAPRGLCLACVRTWRADAACNAMRGPGQRICSLADVCDMTREAERLEALRDHIFLKGCIPRWNAFVGYALFGILAVIVIPLLYHPVKWCVWSPIIPCVFPCMHARWPMAPQGCGSAELSCAGEIFCTSAHVSKMLRG